MESSAARWRVRAGKDCRVIDCARGSCSCTRTCAATCNSGEKEAVRVFLVGKYRRRPVSFKRWVVEVLDLPAIDIYGGENLEIVGEIFFRKN